MATLFFILLLISLVSLAVGLAKPSVFLRFIKKELSRKQIAGIFGSLAIVSFIGIGSFAPSPALQDSVATQNIPVTVSQNDTQEVQDASETSDAVDNKKEVVSVDTGTAKASEVPVPTQQKSDQSPLYSVVSVVDGDTVKLSIDGTTQTIRLIGLDTPETVDPRKPVQCFGKEASNKAKELLTGKSVRLEVDASQGTLDKYGRTLGYIFRDDGLFYNKYMIEQGFAHEYTYNIPYKYQSEFKAAEKSARENQRGLWSPETCNGDTASVSGSSETQTDPATTSSGGKFYTSSYYSSKYYYPEPCDGWKSLSKTYLKSFDSLEALLEAYPSRTMSPQCE
ncbi:thermonuclease family protein [Candidatus Campbellbacteria bacterium]|nr:MAG: thermonuclease family protein [Candidatus Campbellbacteria bacterium]